MPLNKFSKLVVLALLATKSAFAGFAPFIEFGGGGHQNSFKINVTNLNPIKNQFEFDFLNTELKLKKSDSYAGSFGLGFVYNFESSMFIGARLSIQNNGSGMELEIPSESTRAINGSGIKVLSFTGIPISANAFLGFKMGIFKPYVIGGTSTAQFEINPILIPIVYTGKGSMNGFYYGFGLELAVSESISILAEYNKGKITNETNDKSFFNFNFYNIKGNFENEFTTIKLGMRYYFGGNN